MGLCRYCGEKAGWFSDVHDGCVRSAQQGCKVATSLIFATLIEKPPDDENGSPAFAQQLWAKVKPMIDQLATVNRIPTDQLREVLRIGWSEGAEHVATAEPMKPSRVSIMNNFYRAMGFTDEEMFPTDGFVAQAFSVLLWSVMVHGDPTAVASVPRHPFNLKSGEVPLYFFGSVVYSKETVSRGHQGGYGGMSVRVARGVYYHFGGFKGQRIDTTALKKIDYGGLLLTTQNMYFGRDHTNFRIPYNHIVSFRPESAGIGLFRDSANAKAEVFTVLEANPNGGNSVTGRPVIGWFLFNMAHFLAQPEARTP